MSDAVAAPLSVSTKLELYPIGVVIIRPSGVVLPSNAAHYITYLHTLVTTLSLVTSSHDHSLRLKIVTFVGVCVHSAPPQEE